MPHCQREHVRKGQPSGCYVALGKNPSASPQISFDQNHPHMRTCIALLFMLSFWTAHGQYSMPMDRSDTLIVDIGSPVPNDPNLKEAGRLLEKAGKQHQGAIVLMIFTSIGAATYAVAEQSKPEAVTNAVIAVGVAQIISTFINLAAGSNEKKAGRLLQGLSID